MNRNQLLCTIGLGLAISFAAPGCVTPRASTDHLPPVIEWNGASRDIVVDESDPWITPAERSGLTATPDYDETMAWLRRLVDAAPELEMTSLGLSPDGRDIWMVIASKERAFKPESLRATGKPMLFAQAGIHAGEIDGKDAGMMLLRDMTVGGTRRELLDGANFLFVPILSVDGHERISRYSRVNQRGPVEMGWRTNSRNRNLNRDYAKLDTPELRCAIAAIRRWQPDLYYDLHVTDGIDYQYDITFGWSGEGGYSPRIAEWLDTTLRPAVSTDLENAGHIPGPLIFAIDNGDLTKGLAEWLGSPRFSNSYGDACHLPTVLVENHSLKPYDQRVLGTYVLLESTLRLLGDAAAGSSLREAIADDRAQRRDEIPLSFGPSSQPDTIDFLGIAFTREASQISGGEWIRYTGKPERMTLPYIKLNAPTETVSRPRAYWVPAAWPEVIDRLDAHGIRMERLEEPRDVEVELYRIGEHTLGTAPFEGRVQVAATTSIERHRRRYAPGSVRVPTDQPLGNLAVLLLEPGSPDSFFQWGFFLDILQRTEYVEAYAMELVGRDMLARDAALRAEFEAALAADAEFAASPRDRLQWLYRRSPYYDREHLLYPVGRE